MMASRLGPPEYCPYEPDSDKYDCNDQQDMDHGSPTKNEQTEQPQNEEDDTDC